MRYLLRGERQLAKNIASLYGVECANLFVPLLTIPFFARVLGPSTWGYVLFAQGAAAWVTLIVEFGFGFSATRSVAQGANPAKELAAVSLAKVRIAITVSIAVIGIFWIASPAGVPLKFVILGVLAGAAQGLNPYWLLTGIQKMRGGAISNVATRIAWAIAVFILVRSADDAVLILWLLLVANALATLAMYVLAHRSVGWEKPTRGEVSGRLRSGANLFLFTAASGIYGAANVFILGLLAPALQVSWFGSADSVRKVGLRLLTPIGQALFPRVSQSLSIQHPSAQRVAVAGAVFSLLVAILFAGCAFVLAEPIIRVVAGPGYESAVSVLRILAMQLPITALSRSLGVQWMLPNHMDSQFRTIVLAACGANVLLAIWLMPAYGAMGAAWCLLIVEVGILAAMIVCLRHAGKTLKFRPNAQELAA